MFTHLKLYLADTTHDSKWRKINQIWQKSIFVLILLSKYKL